MAVLVFSLRGVPEDEADDVRSLLTDEGIAFHETGAGLLRISLPGLWVKDPPDAARARVLIEAYQQRRSAEQRAAHERAVREGTHRTFFDAVRERPGLALCYLVAVLAILYLSTAPFWRLGR